MDEKPDRERLTDRLKDNENTIRAEEARSRKGQEEMKHMRAEGVKEAQEKVAELHDYCQKEFSGQVLRPTSYEVSIEMRRPSTASVLDPDGVVNDVRLYTLHRGGKTGLDEVKTTLLLAKWDGANYSVVDHQGWPTYCATLRELGAKIIDLLVALANENAMKELTEKGKRG